MKNLIFIFFSKSLSSLLLFLFVPIFIRYLGLESYGLVGFFNSLLLLSTICDFGMSVTINRRFACNGLQEKNKEEMKQLLSTFEIVIWLIALILILLTVILSPYIASSWFVSKELSYPVLLRALILMGIAIGVQLPFWLYIGGLNGLQKIPVLSALILFFTILRTIGIWIFFLCVSASLSHYFFLQIGIGIVQSVVSRMFLYFFIGGEKLSCRFEKRHLKENQKYAIGILRLSITGLILIQMDKIILSHLVPLNTYACYVLASTLANGLGIIPYPFFVSFFPKFSQLVHRYQRKSLKILYQQAYQLLSVFLFPFAAMMIFFSKEILFIWIKDKEIVLNSSCLVSILSIGSLLNNLMVLPLSLQLAYKWAKLTYYQNIISIILLIPLLLLSVHFFGAVGGTFGWLLLNLGYLFIGIQVMHRKILKDEKKEWYMRAVLLPLLGSMIVPFISRFFLKTLPSNLPGLLFVLFLIFFISAILTGMLTPYFRKIIFSKLPWQQRKKLCKETL